MSKLYDEYFELLHRLPPMLGLEDEMAVVGYYDPSNTGKNNQSTNTHYTAIYRGLRVFVFPSGSSWYVTLGHTVDSCYGQEVRLGGIHMPADPMLLIPAFDKLVDDACVINGQPRIG